MKAFKEWMPLLVAMLIGATIFTGYYTLTRRDALHSRVDAWPDSALVDKLIDKLEKLPMEEWRLYTVMSADTEIAGYRVEINEYGSLEVEYQNLCH